MSCPTCDHTMQRISGADELAPHRESLWWCPRCGTLKGGNEDTQKPYLVERCQRFSNQLSPALAALWTQLGIENAIRLPDTRLR